MVPAGVQGYDRYAYVGNDPINATDPTGHCAKYDIDCKQALLDAEKEFSVRINDQLGKWTITGLESIEKGMAKLQGALGPSGFNKLFSHVTFTTGGCQYTNQMCTVGGNVRVGMGVMNDPNYVETNTVHEFGHVWDNDCNLCMSRGMAQATGSYVDASGAYHPSGVPPTDYAGQHNPLEDWAESLKAVIYPSLAQYPMDAVRQQWVETGIEVAGYEPRYEEEHQP